MNHPWNLRIISINVNGLKTDMWTKLRTIHKLRYDIILLQGTKLSQEDMTDDLVYRWKQISDGEAYTEPAISAQVGGVAILLSAHACSRLTNKTTINHASDHHRYIALSAVLNNEQVYIHSVYAPVHRADRPQFFSNLPIPPIPGSHIIAGDFNCIMDASLDTVGDCDIATHGSAELSNWLSSLDAVDAWRCQHDHQKEFTSPSGRSRIDMIFLSGSFTNKYSTEHIPRTIGSDHLCPSATVASSEISNKGGHWQLPTWLAGKASKIIEPMLQDLSDATAHPNYLQRFAQTMKKITARCKAAHKQTLRWRKNKVDRARMRWTRAHLRATENPSQELLEDAERARIAWINEVEARELQKRAWAFDKHFTEAEKCTRFFLTRAKTNKATIIPGVRLDDGTESTNPAHIHATHSKFWASLYSRDANGTENPPSLHNINSLMEAQIPHLPPAAAKSLEADITAEDIVKQINRLPPRKAAGADGLRGELFKMAPKLWADVLLPVYQHILHEQESLPDPFHESVIILLHKKGCSLKPENYRPIALLNVMAKLLSSVHCARLRQVLNTVIPSEQTGFIPGRAITENIIMLSDAIHYSKRNHPTSIILALDFAKAYDRMQWEPMLAILKKMGFGPKFLTTIRAMYKARTAQLSVNGELSNPFPIERGVLQGDPLSPALFILACSPLYAKLNEARPTHGIPLSNNSVAPVATFYADDTTIIARSPESATHLYEIAEWFCEHSGALLHPGKCIAIATGHAPPSLTNGIPILQPTECTTILGVPMGRSITRAQQVGRIIERMMQRCKTWGHVGRTIEGRITVSRANILSTIWYVMAALPSVPTEAKKIRSVINNFINGKEQSEWGGPTTKGNLSSEWFYMAKRQGGWGLAPILRSLKCRKLALLKSFITDKDKRLEKPWHIFATHMIRQHTNGWSKDWHGIEFWHGTQNHGEFGIGDWSALSPWWRDAWCEWLKLDLHPQRNSINKEVLKTWPIWNNRVLARGHGLQSTLRQTFTNSTTRSHMTAIRKEGFMAFGDFMNDDGSIMTPDQLYTAITVCRSVNNSNHVVPRTACALLLRHVNALWANVVNKWLLLSAHAPDNNHIKWLHKTHNSRPFSSASNKLIAKMIADSEPKRATPRLIKIQGEPVRVCWKREEQTLQYLAPSRRDLMQRLIRNALPVDTKRVHWTINAQTNCMLCDESRLESLRHLLWDCVYAKEVWGHLASPWRSHSNTPI